MAEVMQVVPKAYDLALWLIPHLRSFPRDQRFLLGDRIQSTALNVLVGLIHANYARPRRELLDRANLELETLRYLIRMAHDLHYLNERRYIHAAERIDEVGRMIGGWRRSDGGRGPEAA